MPVRLMTILLTVLLASCVSVGDAASALFHYALASRFTRQRTAAELRPYA
jgi:hypothetical protein